ncbi:MAG: DsbC family protein [Azoarcus sp.]|jgi:thiol:disulfide interchange protein DsbC|nr:DsbC family protein [Azoarcus sp.]
MAFTFRSLRAAFLLLAIAAVTVSVTPAAHSDKAEARKGVAAKCAKQAKAHKTTKTEQANAARVRKNVAAFLDVPESTVEWVTRIPQGRLYEVVLTNGELFYTDKAVSFFIIGNIIDVGTRQNLTGERLDKLSRIDFGSLPLEQAIKRVAGNGQRVVVTFEDPNCGYCKRLGAELQKLKDVTIYTFLYPMLLDDSMTKSRHVWCAKDKAATWTAWIVDGKTPEALSCDSSAIDRNMELGRKLRISGSPVLFFANGTRIVGYRSASDLEQILAEIHASAGK